MLLDLLKFQFMKNQFMKSFFLKSVKNPVVQIKNLENICKIGLQKNYQKIDVIFDGLYHCGIYPALEFDVSI